MRRPMTRPMRAVRDVDVEAALDQARAHLVARELDLGVFGCPWCGEPACLTMRLFGPLRRAQVRCAACGVRAIDQGGAEG